MKIKNLKSRFCAKRGLLLMSSALVIAMLSPLGANALSASYYTNASKLSQDKWVKIKTTGEGIHQITYDQLRQWGFENPEKVHVYGYGATLPVADRFSTAIPDDVKLTYTRHENNKIYFYSSGDADVRPTSDKYVEVIRNYFSTDVFYLLSDREVATGEVTSPSAYRTVKTSPLNAHVSVNYIEEELQNPSVGGAIFLGKDIPLSGSINLPVTVKDMGSGVTTWKTSALRVGFAALNSSNTKLIVDTPSQIRKMSYDEGAGAGYAYEEHICFRTGETYLTFNDILPDGTYNFTARCAKVPRFAAVDYTCLLYPRQSTLKELNQIKMFYPGVKMSQNFSVAGPSTIRVINVTTPYKIFEHTTHVNNTQDSVICSFDASYSTSQMPVCHIVAYDVAKEQPGVEFVAEVANQNLHATETPDMLIITTAELMDAAEELAAIHREFDGMDVAVIRHDLLFNEFSSATPDIMGYRRFIKMLYDRNPDKLKHIIMYGPSIWDNRGIVIPRGENKMLVYETQDPLYSGTSTSSYATDCYLGMLNDDYEPNSILSTRQTVAVGRIAAPDLTTAQAINRKIRNYIENPPTPDVYNTAIVMSDDGDGNTHLDQGEKLASILESGREALTVVRAHNSIYQWNHNEAENLRSVATTALNRGVGLFLYMGHGSTTTFGAEKLWSRTVAEKTEYAIHPIAFWGTCDSYGFDLDNGNVGETVLNQETGGVIALIGAGRTVFGPRNQVLATSVVNAYLDANSETTVGQMWLNARNSLLGSSSYTSDYQVNTMCYNLGGDPALRIPAPDYKVRATASVTGNIDGTPVVDALSTTEVEGYITDNNGYVLDDFNGTVKLQLYDAPYQVNVLMRKDDDMEATLSLDQDILLSKTAEVVDGKFSTTFVSPVPVRESDLPNRITFNATSTDRRHAAGVLRNFSVRANDETAGEFPGNPPAIDAMYIQQHGTQTDMANAALPVRLVATGTVDGVGLNNSSAIGSGSTLTIDGKNIDGFKESIKITDDDWNLAITLTHLGEGSHNAVLSIADNAGRRTTQSLNFVLSSLAEIELIATTDTDETSSVDTDGAIIVRDKVTFDVMHELGDMSASRLVIEDLDGNAALSRQNISFPYTLDLKEAALTTGHYNAYIQLTGMAGNGASRRIPVTLLLR